MERIVVGVDGSPGAANALGWALHLAEETGAKVEAIHAWELGYAWIDGYAPDVERWTKEAAAAAQRTLDTAVDMAIAAGPTGVDVVRTVVEGVPTRALLNASRDADLLVVGSRGRGGFAALLLGSVSQQCVQHSRKPVVVVPSAG